MSNNKKLIEGEAMPNFIYDTPFEKENNLQDTAKKVHKTAIIFLRYYGCTLCQLDMATLAKNYNELTANGGQVLVVLQSNAEKIAEGITKETFPYEIICDPNATLYKQFCIQPASSKLKLADAKTVMKIAKASAQGFKHGDYEGDELQLPATFVIDDECKITYAHYGKSASDIPSIEKLKVLLG